MASPPEPAAPPKKRRGRWFKVRVVIAAILLLIAFLVYLNARNGMPPRVLDTFSAGTTYLDVPVMTLYTFPDLGGLNSSVVTNYTIASGSQNGFAWTEEAGSSLTVRFVLLPYPEPTSIAPGSANNFSFSLTAWATAVGGSISGSGRSGVLVAHWVMTYAVREMATYTWFGEDRWIEIDYGLSSPSWCGCALPAANTTLPFPADRVPVGPPTQGTIDAGLNWAASPSVGSLPLPVTTFHNTLPRFSFSLGSQGNVSAALESTFAWNPGSDYGMRIVISGPATFGFQIYLDTRFGSLLVEPLP